MNDIFIAIIDELNEMKVSSLKGKRGGEYRIGLTNAIQVVTSYLRDENEIFTKISDCKCPECSEKMRKVKLTHYKCNKCNKYYTN